MRVAFCGDVANNFYQIAKAVRRWKDIDAHLFVDFNSGQNVPENDDPELVDNYPDWIHMGRPRPLADYSYAAGSGLRSKATRPDRPVPHH